MKIAYVARWDLGRETGVGKKIRDQMLQWRRLGADVRLFALSSSDGVWEGFSGLVVEAAPPGRIWNRDRRMSELLDLARSWAPDVAYVRYSTYYPSLARFMSRVPTVLELNTDDLGEARISFSWPEYAYHRATRGRILTRARGFVAVTHEIAARFAHFGAAVDVIGNGIDLSRIDPVPAQPQPAIRALFVGAPDQPWHGVDKVLDLASRLPSWQFDLVGPAAREREVPPPNVTMHGVLPHASYQRLQSADIAFGTLAMHRNGMNEACVLKVREYLAAGMPCVIGYEDTDFPNAVPFILRLPNVESNVRDGAARITAFGEAWKGRRVARADIAHLDVAVKEQRRLEFLRSVAAGCA